MKKTLMALALVASFAAGAAYGPPAAQAAGQYTYEIRQIRMALQQIARNTR